MTLGLRVLTSTGVLEAKACMWSGHPEPLGGSREWPWSTGVFLHLNNRSGNTGPVGCQSSLCPPTGDGGWAICSL